MKVDEAGISVARGVEDVIMRGNRVIVPKGFAHQAISVSPEAVRTISDRNTVEERPALEPSRTS